MGIFIWRSIFTFCLLFTFIACKPKHISLSPPEVSAWAHETDRPTIKIGIIDGRSDSNKAITHGDVTGKMVIDGQALDPIPYLKTYIGAELEARGYRPIVHSQAPLRLTIKQFELYTRRENVYAPFVVWAAIEGELIEQKKRYPIRALVIKEYYPKFTYSELDAPLYSAALELLVKEVTAKVLTLHRGSMVSDSTIELETEKALRNSPSENTIYALGLSGNPNAIPILTELLQTDESTKRTAAIYGLGILQASDYIPTLTSLYLNSESTIERAIVLKSILEMDRPATNNWVKEEIDKLKKPKLQDPLGLLERTIRLYGL